MKTVTMPLEEFDDLRKQLNELEYELRKIELIYKDLHGETIDVLKSKHLEFEESKARQALFDYQMNGFSKR